MIELNITQYIENVTNCASLANDMSSASSVVFGAVVDLLNKNATAYIVEYGKNLQFICSGGVVANANINELAERVFVKVLYTLTFLVASVTESDITTSSSLLLTRLNATLTNGEMTTELSAKARALNVMQLYNVLSNIPLIPPLPEPKKVVSRTSHPTIVPTAFKADVAADSSSSALSNTGVIVGIVIAVVVAISGLLAAYLYRQRVKANTIALPLTNGFDIYPSKEAIPLRETEGNLNREGSSRSPSPRSPRSPRSPHSPKPDNPRPGENLDEMAI